MNMEEAKAPQKVVRIPIKPYLKKFILIHYKLTEPVPLNISSLLGHQVYAMLVVKRKSLRSNDVFTDNIEMEFRAPAIRKLAYRMGYVVRINHYFDKIFKDCMYTWAMAQDSVGYPPYQGLRDYLRHYGIKEEEYSFENAYRAWMRYKNEVEQKNKSKSQKRKDLGLIVS